MSLEAAIEANTAAIKELTAALIASGALQTAQASAALHSAPGVQAVVAAQKAADEANRRANPPGGQHASAEDARAASQEQSRTAAALAAAKKQDAATDANAGAAATTESKPSGATSAPTPGKSSDVPPSGELKPWADKTAEIYAELKDAEPTAENVKRLIVFGINQKIPGDGRAIAEAVLARFGANAVSEKPGKKGLSADQYPEVFAYGLRVLAGELDPRDSEQPES
ncbi:hypothetical protein BOC50_36410 [Burkholderia pseudomallei]|uniref:hypothetical protein n=1 Tax=Burkholderia pseudomallei TaxID=28450 RepID=UPI000A1A2B34|nr:hypothetical protein [Burkholderia pseudomallei]ARL48200.1 hypothetical protein BOC50_36410 [Burkholderia pseudomallei]